MKTLSIRFSAPERQRLNDTHYRYGNPIADILRGLMWQSISQDAINPHYPRQLDRSSQPGFNLELPDLIAERWTVLCGRNQISHSKGVRLLVWAYPLVEGHLPILAYPRDWGLAKSSLPTAH